MHFISDLVLQTITSGTWDIPQLIVGEHTAPDDTVVDLYEVLYKGVPHYSFNVDDLTQLSICCAVMFQKIWRFGNDEDLNRYHQLQRNQEDDRILRPELCPPPRGPIISPKPFAIIQGGKK